MQKAAFEHAASRSPGLFHHHSLRVSNTLCALYRWYALDDSLREAHVYDLTSTFFMHVVLFPSSNATTKEVRSHILVQAFSRSPNLLQCRDLTTGVYALGTTLEILGTGEPLAIYLLNRSHWP